MGKKQSFAKLTEDLENLEKSEPKVNVEEPVVPVIEPEVVEPVKAEEPVAEEPKAEEPKAEPAAEEPKAEEPKEEPKAEEPVAKSAEEPAAEDPEELEKAKKDKEDKKDPDKDGDDDSDPKKDTDKDKGKGKEKDKEPVKKSADEDEVSEQDFLGAFEAVVKSYSGIKAELMELKKSMADMMALIKPAEEPVVEEPVAKSAEPAAEEPVAEPEEEPVSKSAEEPVDDEGKAVEYVSKSNGVPELPADGEEPNAEPEEEPKAEFNPQDHVKHVTDYFMKNATSLTQGQKAAFRGAVNRVKRGEGTEVDIALFKEVAEFYENSEN